MSHLAQSNFQALRIAALTVSDTRTIETDSSGQTLINHLEEAGHALAERAIVIDDIYRIRAQLSQWIIDSLVRVVRVVRVVLVTGGTGFTARDNTPQVVVSWLDKHVEGFGELFRQVSVLEIVTSSLQSRALAGFANSTLICCLPGSPNACRTGWQKILGEQLDSRTRLCNFVRI
jgi:molybdenum cofactor biosynthesis protein B